MELIGSTVERHYWALPTTYTIGDEYATEGLAFHAAMLRSQDLHQQGRPDRVTIEERILFRHPTHAISSSTDRGVGREVVSWSNPGDRARLERIVAHARSVADDIARNGV